MTTHYITLWAMRTALKERTLAAYSSPWPKVEIMGVVDQLSGKNT